VAASGATLIKGGGVVQVSAYTLTGVANLANVHGLLYYVHNATEANTILIYADLDDNGLPLVGNGQNITVTPDANGLFAMYR
jgi:hypothetical protein